MDKRIKDAVERLRAVDFNGTDSHDRLARICNAFYSPKCGWTLGACEGLRQFIINLLEQADTETHMKVPVDADGVPIHVGDRVVEHEDSHVFVVDGYEYDGEWWVFHINGIRAPVHMCRHYHKPTVEDVLNELCTKAFHSREFGAHVSYRDVIAEYAAKLRLKEESDE